MATSVTNRESPVMPEMRCNCVEKSSRQMLVSAPVYEKLAWACISVKASNNRRPDSLEGQETGGILLELLLVLGFFGAVVLAVFDYNALSVAYVNIGQAAREGVFAVSDIIEFRNGGSNVACSGSDYSALHDLIEAPRCKGPKSEPERAKCAHSFIHLKIENTLKLMELDRVDREKVLITTRCRRIGATSAEFEVMVTGPFRGFSPFFRDSLITVKRLGLIK